EITARRLAIWERYDAWARPLEIEGLLRRPVVPDHCGHNAHMYYVLLPSASLQVTLLNSLKQVGIGATFHYVPLHSSEAGKRYGRVASEMPVTESVSNRLIRLPLWLGIESELDALFERFELCLRRCSSALELSSIIA